MESIPARAAIVMAVLLLGGCATQQLERTAPFTSSSEAALVVFGVDMQSGFKNPALVFLKYDPSTGAADAKASVYASRRRDKLTTGQKVGAFLTGQQSLANEHGYFVLEVPPGDWFLWTISGFYSDGYTSYSANTYLSKGTIAFSAKPGNAIYLGEYTVSGKLGDNLELTVLPANLSAAQAELDTFTRVQAKLVSLEPTRTQFACESRFVLTSRVQCHKDTIVVGK